MADKNLCIISYNSRGFNSCKRDFIRSLPFATGCRTFIFNQENFLLRSNGYIAQKALPEHRIIFKPATKDGLDGRPKYGMFIAVPSCLNENVKEIPVESNRIQSIIVTIESYRMLLINLYFPTDPKTDFDESELLVLLAEIQDILNENDFDYVVFGGDINADFRRKTKFVRIIDEFLMKTEVCRSWDEYAADFTHFMEKDKITYTSTIDHLFWNKTFKDLVQDAGVLHLPENISDHCPIFCKFKLPISVKERPNVKNNNTRFIPSWKNARDEEKNNFSDELTKKVKALDIPLSSVFCKNVHCNNASHRNDLDNLMTEVLKAMEEVARETLQKDRGNDGYRKKNKKLPNWKEDVDPVKDTAHFWHAIWKSAGKPINCHLHMIMKKTRNKYHLMIRKKKRLLERIKRDHMLQSCLDNKGDIFEDIKKQRKCNHSFASMIDGHTDDIPEYFASKNEKLYNGIDDKENLLKLQYELETNIDDQSLDFVNRITTDTVKTVTLRKLRPGKTDVMLNLASDFFIHSPDRLFEILCICFKSYIVHAHVSNFLLISTLVPHIKDKLGDMTSSNNYRSIAISSLVMKIFDLVILSTFSEHLQLDDLQFSYQSEVSTSMCTWLAVETISYFLRNGSEVYTCLMDMSKAFDTVQHSHLFAKLLAQGLPAIIVRYILISYKNQKANVRWNCEESRYFTIANGVKQGAVLSAILYCVYTNGLFQKMRRSNIGCCIGSNYIGILGYADDLYLMAPTLDSLQEMLRICERYAKDHNLKFSTDSNPNKSKTKSMAYLRKKRKLPCLSLCGNKLPWVEHGKHLGMRIDACEDNLLTRDIIEKRARYIQRNNELVQEFAYTSCDTKAFINRVYNSHAYGSVLWNLYGKEADMFFNSWSTSIRKMFRLDRRTHRYLIEPISGMQHIKCAILERFIGFTMKLSMSRKKVIQNTYKLIGKHCQSTIGSNMRHIMLESGVDPTKPITKTDVAIKAFHPIPTAEEWRIQPPSVNLKK